MARLPQLPIPPDPAHNDPATGEHGPQSTLEGVDPDSVPGAVGDTLAILERLEHEAAEQPPGDPPASTIPRPRRVLPKP